MIQKIVLNGGVTLQIDKIMTLFAQWYPNQWKDLEDALIRSMSREVPIKITTILLKKSILSKIILHLKRTMPQNMMTVALNLTVV